MSGRATGGGAEPGDQRGSGPSREELRSQAAERAHAREPVTVADMTVPLLLGTLLSSAVLTYIIGPWAMIWVAIELVAMLILAIRWPSQREAAAAGALGACVGGIGVLALGLLGLIGTGRR